MKIEMLVGLICLFFTSGQMWSQSLDHVQGEVLVLIEDGDDMSQLKRKYERFQGSDTQINIEQVTDYPLNIWKVSIDYTKINENQFLEKIDREEWIVASQKNFLLNYRLLPNDPLFDLQWQFINDGSDNGVEDVDTDVELAWDITTGGLTVDGDTIAICVIDNGIDLDHQDLIPNYWVNRGEIPDNDIDDDNNGYIDDIYGWDAINDDGNVSREGGHGTSVVGIVGAKGNNNLGVSGVNWDVKIINVRGGTNSTNAIKSYTYPYLLRQRYNETNGAEGAFVVATNASWGFENLREIDAPIFCRFYDELGAIGILNISATTNSNRDVDMDGDLPSNCSSPYHISVTNLMRNGRIAPAAGFGNISVDLAAPGEGIYTTGQPDRYRSFPGTSGSSPLVAGTVGLLYSTPCSEMITLAKVEPDQTALLMKDIILGSVDQNPHMAGLTFTEGNLNIGRAVTTANAFCDPCSFPTNLTIEERVNSIDLVWDNFLFAATSELRFRKLGSPTWETQNNLLNSTSIENLESCVTYEVQLRSACPQKGPYSQSYYIKTDNCCEIPAEVSTEIIGDNLKVSWTNITAANNYILEYQEVGQESWIGINTGIPEYILPGITSCEGFNFRVKTICSNDETNFSNPVNAVINCQSCTELDYCGDNFMDNEFEWIQSVQLAGFTHVSGKDIAGFGNWVGLEGFSVVQGEELQMEVDIDHDGGSFNEFGTAYFDWNQNGIFEEEEKSFSPSPSSTILTAMVQVPLDAIPGVTRMRVIMSFEEINSPCKDLTIEYGEIEDYCITVQSSTECNETISIDDFSTELESITVLVSQVNEAIGYEVEYRKSGEETYSTISADSSVVIITGLESCTSYEIRSKSICSNGSSEFSPIRTINTRCTTNVFDPDGLIDSYIVHPNPFSEKISINVTGHISKQSNQVSLVDISGKVLYQEVIQISSAQTHILDNLEEIPPGLYLLRITIGKAIITEKMVKF